MSGRFFFDLALKLALPIVFFIKLVSYNFIVNIICCNKLLKRKKTHHCLGFDIENKVSIVNKYYHL